MKTALAVGLGYLVLAVLAMPVFALVFLAPDFVFRPGAAEATTGFSLLTLMAGFAAAVVGGLVAVRFGKSGQRPAYILAAVVLCLGLAMAIAASLREPPPAKTPEEISQMPLEKRIEHAREPLWYSLSTPLVGAFGVLAGGRLAAGRRSRTDPGESA